jgi:hypothetical protein
MSTLVRYTQEDRVLDLANLSQRDYERVTSLYREAGHGRGKIVCLESLTNDDPTEMFIRLIDGNYWAAHFAGCAHGNHPIAAETDEHRRQKDYWHRAAVDAGLPAVVDFNTPVGTIFDVAIKGESQTGIAVQHSYIETTVAKNRTTRSYRAGWLPVWFVDSDRRPPWFHRVPTMACNPMSWRRLPHPRTATALGLSIFSSQRCTPGAFGRCPAGHKRPCGRWHPKREPWGGLKVDDVAALLPARQILPMRDAQGYVHLVSPESLARYRELTGLAGDYAPSTSDLPPGTPTPTTASESRTPTHCACGQEIYPLTQLVRARDDLCERCRIKEGLPAPHFPHGT